MRRRRHCCCLGLAIVPLIAAGVFHFGGVLAKDRIEKEVAARLPKLIGRAESYTVVAHTNLLELSQGRIGSIDIHGERVDIDGQMTLQSLDANLKDIRFDLGTRTPTRISSAQFSASMGPKDMTDYFSSRYPDVAGRGITLHDGYLTFAAKPEVGGFSLSLNADAKLHILDAARLVVDVTSVSAAGIKVPRIAGQYIEEKLNPVLDTNDWGVKASLDSVDVTPKAVTIRGKIELPKGRLL